MIHFIITTPKIVIIIIIIYNDISPVFTAFSFSRKISVW